MLAALLVAVHCQIHGEVAVVEAPLQAVALEDLAAVAEASAAAVQVGVGNESHQS